MKATRRPFVRSMAPRVSAIAAALWLALINGVPQPGEPTGESARAATARRKPVCAYVYDRAGLSLSDSDAARIDQLHFSFALIENGMVSGKHWQSISAYRAYVAKHPHITPVLAVGGWGADGFSQAAATADSRARFVSSTLTLMREHGFLGVDIDWEYPGSGAAGIATHAQDRERFTLLLRALRDGLDEWEAEDGVRRTLAIAVGGDPSLAAKIDGKAVGAIVDQVNLMTYDMQTAKVASHHAPLYSADARYPLSADETVKAYAKAGIPKEKMMLGVAFYARVFQLKSAANAAVFAPATDGGAKTLQYKALMNASGWTHAFDDQAKAPYAVSGTRFATYDNPLSISHKGAYVLQNGLMGLMCWEYGGDRNGELLAAMRQSLAD